MEGGYLVPQGRGGKEREEQGRLVSHQQLGEGVVQAREGGGSVRWDGREEAHVNKRPF